MSDPLLVAVAAFVIRECGVCHGQGKYASALESDRIGENGERIAGGILFDECYACAGIRKMIAVLERVP